MKRRTGLVERESTPQTTEGADVVQKPESERIDGCDEAVRDLALGAGEDDETSDDVG